MRLINADKLVEKLEDVENKMTEPVAQMFTRGAINDIKRAPEVDAIPIDFIKKKSATLISKASIAFNNNDKNEAEMYATRAMSLQILLLDWKFGKEAAERKEGNDETD